MRSPTLLILLILKICACDEVKNAGHDFPETTRETKPQKFFNYTEVEVEAEAEAETELLEPLDHIIEGSLTTDLIKIANRPSVGLLAKIDKTEPDKNLILINPDEGGEKYKVEQDGDVIDISDDNKKEATPSSILLQTILNKSKEDPTLSDIISGIVDKTDHILKTHKISVRTTTTPKPTTVVGEINNYFKDAWKISNQDLEDTIKDDIKFGGVDPVHPPGKKKEVVEDAGADPEPNVDAEPFDQTLLTDLSFHPENVKPLKYQQIVRRQRREVEKSKGEKEEEEEKEKKLEAIPPVQHAKYPEKNERKAKNVLEVKDDGESHETPYTVEDVKKFLSKMNSPDLLNEDKTREGRDLVYERMKMRSGVSEPRKKDVIKPVGGGILERKMLEDARSNGRDAPQSINAAARTESREMQCCDHIEVYAEGGVLECHPYVIGEYKKIGVCGGRSFYQHKNNTDIFLYHACGAWYLGLEVGSCGGWMLAKSTELCASGYHQASWKYFNEGKMEEDESFQIVEQCQFYNDFRPVPTTGPPSNPHRPSFGQTIQHAPRPTMKPWNKKQKDTVKHEHYHYHIKVDDDKKDKSPYKPIQSVTLPQQPKPIYHQTAQTQPRPVITQAPSIAMSLYEKQLMDRYGQQHQSPLNQFFSPQQQKFNLQTPFSSGIGLTIDQGKVSVEPLKSHGVPHEPNAPNHQVALVNKRPPQHQSILINNYHARTAPTTTTTTQPPTTAARYPYGDPSLIQYRIPPRRPSSDLQSPQKPMGIRDKINYELVGTSTGSFAGSNRFQDPDKMVGYIIKKRPVTSMTYEVSSDGSAFQSFGGRNLKENTGKETKVQSAQIQVKSSSPYFPLARGRSEEDGADKNSRRLL